MAEFSENLPQGKWEADKLEEAVRGKIKGDISTMKWGRNTFSNASPTLFLQYSFAVLQIPKLDST